MTVSEIRNLEKGVKIYRIGQYKQRKRISFYVFLRKKKVVKQKFLRSTFTYVHMNFFSVSDTIKTNLFLFLLLVYQNVDKNKRKIMP